MKVVRYNTFETNSSSTHSMLIPLERPEKLPKCVSFRIDEFGWEVRMVNPRDYLYTALYSALSREEADLRVEQIKHVLDEAGIAYEFEEPLFDEDGDLEYGYIDHTEDLWDFFDGVFESDSSLLNFIVAGKVGTGNDNDDEATPVDDLYNSMSKEEQAKYRLCYKGN